MPNVMVALPNICGALCSTPQSLADAHYYMYMPCSNAAKTRKPLKVAGVPKLPKRFQPLVGRRSPYSGYMWKRYCCLTSIFPIVDKCLSCEDIARQSCAMVPRWRFFASFLHPVFSASHVQYISDLHSKFALRPHHCVELWQTFNLRPLRLGEEIKKKKKEET